MEVMNVKFAMFCLCYFCRISSGARTVGGCSDAVNLQVNDVIGPGEFGLFNCSTFSGFNLVWIVDGVTLTFDGVAQAGEVQANGLQSATLMDVVDVGNSQSNRTSVFRYVPDPDLSSISVISVTCQGILIDPCTTTVPICPGLTSAADTTDATSPNDANNPNDANSPDVTSSPDDTTIPDGNSTTCTSCKDCGSCFLQNFFLGLITVAFTLSGILHGFNLLYYCEVLPCSRCFSKCFPYLRTKSDVNCEKKTNEDNGPNNPLGDTEASDEGKVAWVSSSGDPREQASMRMSSQVQS